jgi:hypothetical protein
MQLADKGIEPEHAQSYPRRYGGSVRRGQVGRPDGQQATQRPDPRPDLGDQMRRIAAVLTGALALSGLILFSAGPASAATPQCTSYRTGFSPLPPPVGPEPGTALIYPTAANGSSYCWMQRGNNSIAVWALQFTLYQCYGLGLALDGDFGPATQRALTFAQSISGARPDGAYGPDTRSHLKYSRVQGGGPYYCYQLLGFG